MLKNIIFLIIILQPNYSFSQQNLVPNGSFEDTLACPNGPALINYSKYWSMPSAGTSDYFHPCAIPFSTSVPNNYFGFQYAKNGVAYAGLLTYFRDSKNYKEYLQNKLISALEMGKKYCVSFYISLADSVGYSTSNMGLYFSNNAINSFTSSDVFNVQPQITENLDVNNRMNWILIEKEYIADGTENYITIGNFDDSNKVVKVHYNGYTNYDSYSYYYIDDVSIKECVDSDLSISELFTPNNDGFNDKFEVNLNEKWRGYIFNRWGNKIADLNNEHNYWNGTYKGGNCSPSTYYYLIETEDKKLIKKGFIQLIR